MQKMKDKEKTDAILAVGSGTVENVVTAENGIQSGGKYITDRYELYGGSGLNHTFRLVTAGHPVLPALSIGADRAGRRIQKDIAAITRKKIKNKHIIDFIEDSGFLCNGLHTPQSTIIVSRGERTIFSENIKGIHAFKDFTRARLSRLADHPQINVKAVMIGHIYADNPRINTGSKAETTKWIIRKFKGKAVLYANFGVSQFGFGERFWEDYINHIDIFQLALTEARRFFNNGRSRNSLVDIIRWFRDREKTAIITLDKFGALATYKGGKDGLIFAWPFELNKLVDSTGAGDAFGAGMIGALYKKEKFSFTDFLEAIKNARLWAAYACCNLGGANNCPNQTTLKKFETTIRTREFYPIEIKNIADSDLILRLLDKAY